MRRPMLAAVLTLCSAYLPVGGPAYADDLYAAFAAVRNFGQKYHGYAPVQTREAARMLALRDCKNVLCRVMQEYKEGECVYVFLGDHQVFWNIDQNSKKEMAAYCARYDNNCRSIVSECLH